MPGIDHQSFCALFSYSFRMTLLGVASSIHLTGCVLTAPAVSVINSGDRDKLADCVSLGCHVNHTTHLCPVCGSDIPPSCRPSPAFPRPSHRCRRRSSSSCGCPSASRRPAPGSLRASAAYGGPSPRGLRSLRCPWGPARPWSFSGASCKYMYICTDPGVLLFCGC